MGHSLGQACWHNNGNTRKRSNHHPYMPSLYALIWNHIFWALASGSLRLYSISILHLISMISDILQVPGLYCYYLCVTAMAAIHWQLIKPTPGSSQVLDSSNFLSRLVANLFKLCSLKTSNIFGVKITSSQAVVDACTMVVELETEESSLIVT